MNTLVFIDSNLNEYQTLVTEIVPRTEVFILSSDQDGMVQISTVLQQHPETTTVHIVSHGSPGSLFLGNSQLNLTNIYQYQAILGTWNVNQILLYGCNVASGDAGSEFISKLHQFTGANITATATLTGNAVLGGNWDLEVSFPENKETSLVFSEETLANYQGVFAIKQFGTSSSDSANGNVIDNDGNLYVVGSTFGNLLGNTNLGGSDVFITKYDKLGNQIWTKQIGSTADDSGYGITIDKNGNLYIYGQTAGSLPGQTNKGQADIFLAKYDTLGNQIWLRQFASPQFSGGGNENASVNGISTDSNGNIYLTAGTFGGDASLFKYDALGNQIFAKLLGSSNAKGNAIITNSDGTFYATGNAVGNFAGNINQGLADAYIAKYDALGNQLWAKLLGTSASDFSNGIGKDNNGNLYIVGQTSGSLAGNPNQGGQDSYIAKYDGLGNQIWAKQFGTSTDDVATAIKVDANNNIYVIGYTNGSLAGNTSQGGQDAYIAKYDTLGNRIWLKQFGTASGDQANGISINSNGIIYVTGSTFGSLSNNTNLGESDAFIASFDSNGNLLNNLIQGTQGNDTFIGQNGSYTINGLAGFDTIDYSQLATGITLKSQGIIDKGTLGIDTIQVEKIIANTNYINLIDASASSNIPINVNLSTNTLKVFGLPSGDVNFDVYNFQNVKGSQRDDTITGDNKNNILDGQNGNDLIYATKGNDTIIGGNGFDIVDYSYLESAITLKAQGIITKGIGGTDTVQAETIVANALYVNSIDASASANLAINANLSLNNLTVFGLPSGEVAFNVVNFQNVTGSQANDIITGNENNNILDGQSGNDLFFGTQGRDTILGGNGIDTIDYSQLAAGITLKSQGIIDKGSLGIDTVQVEKIIGNAQFINVIDSSSSTTTSLNVDLFNNSLQVLGTPTGTLNFFVQNFSNVFGSQLADTIKGNDANNTLKGNDGNDTLIGGLGADILDGGDGIDTASYITATSAVNVNLGTGKGSLGEALNDTFISIENVTGSAFNDNITGNILANILNGGAGNDILTGGAGNDIIIGEAGNDIAIYTGAFSQYQISRTGGVFTIADLIANRDGTDTLNFIEQAQFSDQIITLFNLAPTNISLSNTNIAENQSIATLIGNFTTTDPNVLDNIFTYSLVSGTGATDNALFSISNNQLKANQSFDFETKNSYSIRVQTKDQGGLTFEKQLTIGVTNVNESPTNIILSNTNIAENQVIGTVIGNLTTTDPDLNNTFTYSLITGTGSTDNALFSISNNQLKANSSFDFETKNSYSIRVQTKDQGGLTFEKQLNIGITNVDNIITGNATNENFTTTAEKDIIDVQGGNDIITSIFTNLQQNDIINGGTGYDTLNITGGNATNSISIDLGNTTNQLNISGTKITNFEQFNLGNFAGITNFVGDSSNNIFNSGNGNDIINAGDGNDIINAGDGNDIITGGKGKDILTGGLGSDRFDYRNLTDSTLDNFDAITDFNASLNNDIFMVMKARGAFNNVGAINTFDVNGINSKLTSTNFAANGAAQFSVGSRSFIAINDEIAGFNKNTDSIIEITGFTGTLGINNFKV